MYMVLWSTNNLIINLIGWLGICFGIANSCGSVWSNGVGQNRETDKEHDKDCVEEEFQLAKVKFGRDSEGGREDLGMGNRSII